MNEYIFSFENYIDLLRLIKKFDTLKDYTDVIENPDDPFILLRHDVEFSVKRAYDLAVVENQHDIKSTYLFQVTNNAYNVLSGVNITFIKKIISLGHKVGLHFHLQGCTNIDQIRDRILFESELLSSVLGVEIDRFSFHRPPLFALENHIEIPGLINTYDPLFFTFTNNVDNVDFTQSVKYIADSRNQWSYTSPWDRPCEELFLKHPKIQILCHPYSWCEKGAKTLDNLKILINENREEFVDTLNNETKYVRQYLDELQ